LKQKVASSLRRKASGGVRFIDWLDDTGVQRLF